MNGDFQEVERLLHTSQIMCKTVKLTISGKDIYFKIGYAKDRPVYIDITFGWDAEYIRKHEVKCSKCKTEYLNAEANELATQLVTSARAHLEVTGWMATAMLQSGVWGLDDIIGMWRATNFEPAGLCLQLPAFDLTSGDEIEGSASIVNSPLDAFARYAERRRRDWEKELCE